MTKTDHSKKGVEISAWVAYSIIFFEMLYMSTPFAVFFYSVYATPLKWLASSEKTAWLIHPVFPHFSESGSKLINFFLYISFPLMILGIIVFVTGFIQIYYAKFARKGAVTIGIYKYMRHPQYAAWIIFGLGMCLFWSRMIVWITYVAMLFIYKFLAHAEEQECLAKYGDSYRDYMEKTGGFFPKISRHRGRHFHGGVKLSRPVKAAAALIVFVAVELFVIWSGMVLREHGNSSLYGVFTKDRAVLALVKMQESEISRLFRIIESNPSAEKLVKDYYDANRKQLVYIMPYGWDISELLMDKDMRDTFHDTRLFANPSGHGNMTVDNNKTYRLLFSIPVCPPEAEGKDILTRATRQNPFLLVDLDIESGRVINAYVTNAGNRYGDIPVPLY